MTNLPFIRTLINNKLFEEFLSKIKAIHISTSQISLYRFLEIFFSQVKKDNIVERAHAMAFNFTLSVFPAIIFLFTLIPYIPIPDLSSTIMETLRELMPASMFMAAESTIFEILNIQHGGLLSFGFIFAMYTATNGNLAMISAFNRCYSFPEQKSFIQRMLKGIALTVFLVLIVCVSVSFSLVAKVYLDMVESTLSLDGRFYFQLLYLLKYWTIFMVLFFATSFIYYVAPAIPVKWSFFSGGALVAAVLIMVFTLFFSFYVDNFNSYNKVYGSIGTLIAFMIWLHAISMALLIGFEINASLDMARREKFSGQA
ncbi:MAG TPA: YihY/virulence factor BrkB family protein [Cytophagaceae bacterium]